MRTSLASAAALLFLLSGCQLLDQAAFPARRRNSCLPQPNVLSDSVGTQNQDSLTPPVRKTKRDTCLYFSAVIVPEDYDWQRDSACGASEGRLVLYKDFKETVSMKTGGTELVSTDPDTHHIVDGHLYTEFSTLKETIVKKDGKELFRYSGREFLKGILADKDVLWTLGQDRSGEGFSLRKNGEEVFRSNKGEVFGNLHLSPGGGLYLDNGRLCFCYCIRSGSGTLLYRVSDQLETPVENHSYKVHDMRVYDGEAVTLVTPTEGTGPQIIKSNGTEDVWNVSSITLTEGYLVATPQGIGAAGFLSSGGYYPLTFSYWCGVRTVNPSCSNYYVYPCQNGLSYITYDQSIVRLTLSRGASWAAAERCYFFSRSCAVTDGIRYSIALTPYEKGGKPYIVTNGTKRTLDINGFITNLNETIEEYAYTD